MSVLKGAYILFVSKNVVLMFIKNTVLAKHVGLNVKTHTVVAAGKSGFLLCYLICMQLLLSCTSLPTLVPYAGLENMKQMAKMHFKIRKI